MTHRLLVAMIVTMAVPLPLQAQVPDEAKESGQETGQGSLPATPGEPVPEGAGPQAGEDTAPPQPEQTRPEDRVPAQTTAASPPPTEPVPVQVRPAEKEAVGMSDLSLEGLLNLKITVASKSEETVSQAPSVVTVFTHDDIKRLGVRTVEQLLNFVPGFQANPDESDHYQRINVRGRISAAAESVLMLVDGQRVNDLYFGGIGALDHGMPTENIEQVEIIRGPGSALYGANAFLGIINIKTNRSRNDVTAGAGDMNRRYAALNLAKSYGDLKVASFAKVYADEGSPYADTTDAVGRVHTAYDPVKAMNSTASVEYRGLYLRAGYANRQFDGMTCCGASSPYGASYRTTQTRAQAGYARALTTDIDLDSSVGFQRETYTYLWPQPSTVPGGLPTETGTLWRTWGVNGNADLQWRLLSVSGFKLALMAGGTYAHNRLSANRGISAQDPITGQNWGDLYETPTPFFGDPSRAEERNVFAGYLQAKVNLLSQLALTVGARYDHYTDFGSSLNPRAAVVWTTPFKSDLKLAYGRAFRAPTLYEVGLSPPSLKPETVGTVEASYVQQITDIAQATVDFFYQKIDDVIGYTSSLTMGNVGSYTTKGLELELRTRELYGARLLGSYTHLWREASDPGLTPGDYGSVAVDYSWRVFMANVSTTIHGKNNQSQSLWVSSGPPLVKGTRALFNVRLQAEVTKGFRAFATVNNVFDYRYQPAGLNSAFFARGRTFLLGLSADL